MDGWRGENWSWCKVLLNAVQRERKKKGQLNFVFVRWMDYRELKMDKGLLGAIQKKRKTRKQ